MLVIFHVLQNGCLQGSDPWNPALRALFSSHLGSLSPSGHRAAPFKDPWLTRFLMGRVSYLEKWIPLIETSLTCLWLSHRLFLSGWNKSDVSCFLDCSSCSSLFWILGDAVFCFSQSEPQYLTECLYSGCVPQIIRNHPFVPAPEAHSGTTILPPGLW